MNDKGEKLGPKHEGNPPTAAKRMRDNAPPRVRAKRAF